MLICQSDPASSPWCWIARITRAMDSCSKVPEIKLARSGDVWQGQSVCMELLRELFMELWGGGQSFLESCPGFISAAVIKCPNKQQLRREWIPRSSQALVKSTKAGDLQQQELQMAGHITCAVRGWERVDAGVSSSQLAFSNPV